jgi:hypothetical protein
LRSVPAGDLARPNAPPWELQLENPEVGMKVSGNARELGPEGLEAFRQSRYVHLDARANRKPWWYPYGREG